MEAGDLTFGAQRWSDVRCYTSGAKGLFGHGYRLGIRPRNPNPAPPIRRASLRGCCPPLPTASPSIPITISKPSAQKRCIIASATYGSGKGADSSDSSSSGAEGGAPKSESWAAAGGDDSKEYGGEYFYDPDAPLESPKPAGMSLANLAANLDSTNDTNALQTALAAAIQLEDFQLAAAVRDRLRQISSGTLAAGRIDWGATGLPCWLADRAQRLGYRFPTEIQRRSVPVLMAGCDAVVASETGSGKTLSFLMPLLARMSYPPDIFLDDLKGPQALIVVPTLELGVQVALTSFCLLGGNTTSSAGRGPGDPANMFTYNGPKGIRVRGLLTKEEVVMAQSSLTYLSGVHLVVATPAALREAVGQDVPGRMGSQSAAGELLRHLKVLAIDEVDECFSSFTADMEAIMTAAADPRGQGNSQGVKPQVMFVGATQRQDVLQQAVAKGWLTEPVNIQVGREGAVPPALSHRYIVVPSSRRLAALARSLRSDLAAADESSAPARVMLFVDTPAQAAALAGPLRSSLWADHRMALLVPPGTVLGSDVDSDEAPGAVARGAGRGTGGAGGEGAALRRGRRGDATSPGAGRPRYDSDGGVGIGGGGGQGSRGQGSGLASASGSESYLAGRGGGAEALEAAVDDMFAYNPIRALHSFRDKQSSLLLATGAAARGLDLPGVSHVYSLGTPPDATQYLHRAGRAGRIGCTTGGVVTTLVTPEEVPALLDIGQQLGIQLVQEAEVAGEAVGVLPRLQAPPDEDEGEQHQHQEEDKKREGRVGAAAGSASQQGASGRSVGVGEDEAALGSDEGLGDVEILRKGLEDLFHLM